MEVLEVRSPDASPSGSSALNSETKVRCCIHCKSKIHDEASFCVSCSKSQNRFQSLLLSFAGVSAALTILAGVVAYIAQSAPILYESYFGGDIDIVSFSMLPDAQISLNVSNVGTKPILINQLQFFFPKKDHAFRTGSYTLDAVVGPGSIKLIDEDISSVNERYSYPHAEGMPSGWKLDGDKLYEILGIEECFGVLFVEKGGGSVSTVINFYRQTGSEVIQVQGEAWIRFFSTARRLWFEKRLEAMAILVRKNSVECEGFLGDLPAKGGIFD